MSKTTCDCVCFRCLTPNRVAVGTAFYEAKAWFNCFNCNFVNELSIKTKPLTAAIKTMNKGVPIE